MFRWSLGVLLLIGLFLATVAARAYGGDVGVFRDTYNLSTGSRILKANCSICHMPGHIELENPYGAAMVSGYRAAGKNKATPEILHALDALDSDGDGATNLEEIKADSLPWDATSVPSKPLKVATLDTTPTLDGMVAALLKAEPIIRQAGGVPVAEVRLATAGTNLALSVQVTDKAITPATKDWTGTAIELGVFPDDAKAFRRLVISPRTADTGTVQLIKVFATVATPAITWKVTARDGGYYLAALIPMATLGIDPAAKTFPVDVAVTTVDGQYTSLFDRAKGFFDHAGWVVTSVTGNAHQVVEGSGDRWSTNRTMKAGDWLLLDMQQAYTVVKVTMDSSISPNDAAQGLQVLTSMDGKTFTEIGKLSAEQCKAAKGLFTFTVTKTDARYIKFVQSGATGTSWWSVNKISVDIAPQVP
jgi:hypothetical protein